MAMTPSEQSRPTRKWPSSGAWVEEPLWAAAVVIVFLAGLSMLAKGAPEVARTVASDGSDSTSDVLPPLALCVLGLVIVVALLIAFGGHPRTRSAAASASFAIMRALMFLAGVVLFLGGSTPDHQDHGVCRAGRARIAGSVLRGHSAVPAFH
jgi:hypothetical protein